MNTSIRLTKPPKHHFFGFHDLPAWNFNGNKILSLEVDIINRPPLPNELAGVGFCDTENRYNRLGSTCAFNYPQGARMQWIGNSDNFIVNNKVGNLWGSNIYNTETCKMEDELPFSCHCLDNSGLAFTINYSRLFRLGAYGYGGVDDLSIKDALPANDGIFVGNIKTKESRLLVSIAEIANHPQKLNTDPFAHHYITHLLLNPSNKRLAFLHRYSLPDGGEITRLMTINTDGSDLRCLASGFLSHFDWKDDNSIFIFGRANSNLDNLRSNHLFSLPVISTLAQVAKKTIKIFIKTGSVINSNFLIINDSENGNCVPVAQNILISDGHPMFCPKDRDWIINDTYPNETGIRTLMLYQFSTNKRIDLGTFKMIMDKPDMKDQELFFEGVDKTVLKSINSENLAFTRSGLHCDLHPRWDQHGKKVAFDSIHEGYRQIYVIDLTEILKNNL